MLNNAGNKLVFWSKFLLYLGIALSVIAGFVIIWRGARVQPLHFEVYRSSYLYRTGVLDGTRVIVCGFLVMIFGSLVSWITALLIRAFGDLSVDTKAIREQLEAAPAAFSTEDPADTVPEKPARQRVRKPTAKTAEDLDPSGEK